MNIPIQRKKGIAVAIISGRGSCPIEMVTALALQSWPTNTNITFATVYGFETDEGRINAATRAIENGLKYIWYIDDDTVPPPDAGRQLLYTLEQNPKAMVAAGIYTTRSSPPEPLVYLEQGAGPHWDWKVGEVFKVWGAGTGCMMVNLEVFNHIPEPWFKTVLSSHEKISDDLYFCEKVAQAGFEVWANGKVLCHHYDMENGIVYMLPRESAPYRNRIEKEFCEPVLIGG
jgi:cellulose synthase/poly-beta-1,6-N-acetylglucosamine synthase-like glycosyltransferase